MTKPALTYTITGTKVNPDGSKILFLTVTRTEVTNITDPKNPSQTIVDTVKVVSNTSLLIKPDENEQERINAYMATSPV